MRTPHTSTLRQLATGALTSLLVCSPTLALAQESAAAQETTVAGGDLMLASYIGLWVLIFAFVALVLRSQRALQSDVDHLERRLDQLLDDSTPKAP